MTTALYQLCRQIFPELADTAYPKDPNHFSQFIAWANHQHSNIQYVELKEYYDNGTDKCYQLQQASVDIEQLNTRIEEEVEQLFIGNEETEVPTDIDTDEHIYAVLFDNINAVAEQHGLALLLISNEHPYWMLAPDQTDLITLLIEAFNATFSDVDLYQYV